MTKTKNAKPAKNGNAMTEANKKMLFQVRDNNAENQDLLEELEQRLQDHFSELEILSKKRGKKKEADSLWKDAERLEEFLHDEFSRVDNLSTKQEGNVKTKELKEMLEESEDVQMAINCIEEDFGTFEEELEEVQTKK